MASPGSAAWSGSCGEEKERSLSPPSPAVRSPSPSSTPACAPSSSSSLVRSASALCVSIRAHRPAVRDSLSAQQLRASSALLTALSSALRSALRQSGAAERAAAEELRAVGAEHARLAGLLKDEGHRRRKAERSAAALFQNREIATAASRRKDNDAALRLHALQAELSALRRRHEVTVDDWLKERAALDAQLCRERQKRARLTSEQRRMQAVLAESAQRLTASEDERAALISVAAMRERERAELLSERDFLNANRSEVQDANIRLQTASKALQERAAEAEDARRSWDEERSQWLAKEKQWQRDCAELVTLRSERERASSRAASVEAQSTALAALTTRLQERTEALDAEYAADWGRVKALLREEMWSDVSRAEAERDAWRARAEEAQHQAQLQAVDSAALHERLREASERAQLAQQEEQRKADAYATSVRELQAELQRAREREAEADTRVRQSVQQLRALTDEVTAEQSLHSDTQRAAAAAAERAQKCEAGLRERALQLEAEVERRQEALQREMERGRQLCAELNDLRAVHVHFVDPVQHSAVQLELSAAHDESAALQRAKDEQAALLAGVQATLAQTEEGFERRLASAEETRRSVEGRLHSLQDEQHRAQLQAKEVQLALSARLKDAAEQLSTARTDRASDAAELSELRKAARLREEQSATAAREADERVSALRSELRQSEREHASLLHQQHLAQQAQGRDWEALVADKARQLDEAKDAAAALRSRLALTQAAQDAAESGAHEARSQLAEALGGRALAQQELVAAQAENAALVHQHFVERQQSEEDCRRGEEERDGLRHDLADVHARLEGALTDAAQHDQQLQRGRQECAELQVQLAHLQRSLDDSEERRQAAEKDRGRALEAEAQAEAEARTHREAEADRAHRLRLFTAQLREQQDDLTALRVSHSAELQAQATRLRCSEEALEEEKERCTDALKEVERQSAAAAAEKARVAALTAELDGLRLLHVRFVDPAHHTAVERQRDAARSELGAVRRALHEQRRAVSGLQVRADAANDALELELGEVQSVVATQQKALERDAQQSAAQLEAANENCAALAARLSLRDAELQAEREFHSVTKQSAAAYQRRQKAEGDAQRTRSQLPPTPLSLVADSDRAAGSTFQSTSALSKASWRSKHDASDAREWKEEEKDGSAQWRDSVVLVNAAQHSRGSGEPLASVWAGLKAAKAETTAGAAPLPGGGPQWGARDDDVIVHLRSELRLQAIELDDLHTRIAGMAQQHRDEQRQWVDVLDRAVAVNQDLKQRLSSRPRGQDMDRAADERGADDEDGGVVTIEIEETLHSGTVDDAAPFADSSAVPRLSLSGRASGAASTGSRGDSDGRRGGASVPAALSGGGAGAAGRGRDRGLTDRSQRSDGGGDDEDEEDGPHRRPAGAPQSAHYDAALLPTKPQDSAARDWSKTTAFSPRASSQRTAERFPAGEQRSVREDLSARLSVLEAEHAALRAERDRLVVAAQRDATAASPRTAPPLRSTPPSSRLSSPRQGREASQSSALWSSPPSLSSAGQLLSAESAPASGSAVLSAIDSLSAQCRQQAEELQHLRLSNRELLAQLQQQQPQHQARPGSASLFSARRPLSPEFDTAGAGARMASPPAFSSGAESRLLQQLQHSDSERAALQARLHDAQEREAEAEDARRALETELRELQTAYTAQQEDVEEESQLRAAGLVDFQEQLAQTMRQLDHVREEHEEREDRVDTLNAELSAERSAGARREEEAARALTASRDEVRELRLRAQQTDDERRAAEAQLIGLKRLLAQQAKEAEGWKALAEEREAELQTLGRREEESVDVMRALERELRQTEEALLAAEGEGRRLHERVAALEANARAARTEAEGQRAAAQRTIAEVEQQRAAQRRDEADFARLSAESARLHGVQERAQATIASLRAQCEALLSERSALQSRVEALSLQAEAHRRAQAQYREALEAQAAAVEGMGAGQVEAERERAEALSQVQARSIEHLLAVELRAQRTVEAIHHEALSAASEEKDQRDIARTPPNEQDGVVAARDTMRRLRAEHERRKAQR